MAWCHVHSWTTLRSNKVYIVDNPEKSNWTQGGLSSKITPKHKAAIAPTEQWRFRENLTSPEYICLRTQNQNSKKD